MQKPIENVVRIRGFVVQPIESLSLAKSAQRAVILYAFLLRAVQDAGADRLMRYNDPGGGGGGGTQIWFRRGYAAEAAKPVPIFKGHFGGKRVPIIALFFLNVICFNMEEIRDLGLNAHFRELQKNTRKKKGTILWRSVNKCLKCVYDFASQ